MRLSDIILRLWWCTGSPMMVMVLFIDILIVADIVPSLSTSVRMVVVVMELWTTHPAQARFAHASRSARAYASRWRHPCWTTGASHVRGVRRRLNCFAVVDLGHSSNTSTPQSWVLVAIAPTVNSSLNKTSLSTKARIQLGQSPTNSVALSLIH